MDEITMSGEHPVNSWPGCHRSSLKLVRVDELIEELAARAAIDPEGVLEKTAWLGLAIDSDARAGRFDGWGWSTVMDEHVGGAVVPEALFAALHARAGIRAQWPAGNAGLLHVYGYLLSTVRTPYGFKRDRWLDGALACAYGLPAQAFVPWASDRTLLDRVTDATDKLRQRKPVRVAKIAGASTSLSLGQRVQGGACPLLYLVDGRLVTTFLVEFPEQILAEWDEEPPRLRWNAATPPR